MKCYKCNAEVKENAKFCPNCGATLRCTECGEELHGEKFCPNCGTATARKQNHSYKSKKSFKEKISNIKEKYYVGRILIVACLFALILGLSIGIPISNNTFRKAKVSKIEIGMTQDEVKEILGEPHEEGRGGSFWTYYEKKAKKQIEKMSDDFFDSDSLDDAFDGLDKAYSKLEKMSYKSIVVEFGGKDSTVSSIALNKNTKYDEPLFGANYECQKPKELKEISLSKSTVGIGTNIRNEGIYYTAEFKDGSYRKALISDWSGFSTAELGVVTHKFSDEWAKYTIRISVV